ncbi:serpentine type 7TM GPCR chemoreceptor srt domain-containing protein [Ditylenchus destructor]|uniref:Serpentine type 7TM GPCR chemoreceptor srt domain-containing protein n=1 Tax=Ditylenchus destructor TaxID=166010 RepID=A0AAD4MYE6_9BILA|nr:serpentine type 7TM GPCR chemoreceptor srt domain-containing protein [Ditylenchus destructor]
MEMYLFRSDQWKILYNCSKIRVNDVAFGERYHPINGVVIIAMFVVFEALYLPCAYSICRRYRNSCYILLFFIAIVDVVMLCFHGLVVGILCFTGDVFCSNPHFTYITGCFASALFVMETSANFFLALDRCADCISPAVSKFFFSEKRVFIWAGLSSLLAMYYFFFFQPAIYSGIYMNSFMNPFQGYNVELDLTQYSSLISTSYNLFLSFGFPAAYLIFISLFVYKVKLTRSFGSETHRKKQMMIFIQVALINGLNVSSSILYTIMQQLPMSKMLIIIGYYLNYFIFGFPPIIFLVFNTSIRRDCHKMFQSMLNEMSVRLHKRPISPGNQIQFISTFVDSK